MITYEICSPYQRTINKCNSEGIPIYSERFHEILEEELLLDELAEEYDMRTSATAKAYRFIQIGAKVETEIEDRTCYNVDDVLSRAWSKPRGIQDNMRLCRLKLVLLTQSGMVEKIIDLGKFVVCKTIQDRIRYYNAIDNSNSIMYLQLL